MTPTARNAPTSTYRASSGDILDSPHLIVESERPLGAVDSLIGDLPQCDAQGPAVPDDFFAQVQTRVEDPTTGDLGEPSPPTTGSGTTSILGASSGDCSGGGHRADVAPGPVAPAISCPPDPTMLGPAPSASPSDGWAALRLVAEMYEDAQKSRIGCENRVRSSTVDPDITAASLAALENAEKELKKALRNQYRRTVPQPIRQWQADTRGIGEHLLARLLGIIGHPIIARPHHWEGEGTDRVLIEDEPFARNVAKLWAYCGHGDPTRKRTKGMTADQAAALGNPRAKMIVHLLAESCIKSANPDYRLIYDQRRAVTETDRPDWTKGHRHNDALHIMGKEILRDLWRSAR